MHFAGNLCRAARRIFPLIHRQSSCSTAQNAARAACAGGAAVLVHGAQKRSILPLHPPKTQKFAQKAAAKRAKTAQKGQIARPRAQKPSARRTRAARRTPRGAPGAGAPHRQPAPVRNICAPALLFLAKTA